MLSLVTTILSALYGYLVNVWTVARMVFSVFDTEFATSCIQLLAVVLVIGIIDSLPDLLKRKKKKEAEE